MNVSLVLPVYNEAACLPRNLRKIGDFMDKMKCSYEIIIAEDGSTDGTDKIASFLASSNKRVVFLHSSKRKGKGRAIKDAFRIAKGEILSFMDIDLSSDIRSFPELVNAIQKGADVAIGSRNLPQSKSKRGIFRGLVSRWYNILVRMFFDTKVSDFQCGFKAFSRSVLPTLLAARSDHFFWDTEALLMCERKKMKIEEIPISWKEVNKTKIVVLKDSLRMLHSLIRIRLNMAP